MRICRPAAVAREADRARRRDEFLSRPPRFGFGFGAGMRMAGASFDPATLPLTGWWRASYSGSPWAGVASAGSSGGRDLSEATNPPAVGSALDGRTPADFITNDRLSCATGMSTFVSDAAGMAAVVFYADTAPTKATDHYDNPPFIADATSGQITFYFSASGIGFGSFNGVNHDDFDVACSSGAWHLGIATWDAITMKLSLDGGPFSTLTRAVDVNTNALRVGYNWNASVFFDGRIADLMIGQFTASTTDVANLYSYAKARYPSAGLP